MAQQGILRETAIEHSMYRAGFVNSFAGKNPFAVKVLINVGNGARVDVEPSLSGIDVRKARARRALNTDANARLKNSIACNHDVLLGINDGLVQWMRHCADHAMSGTAWQF